MDGSLEEVYYFRIDIRDILTFFGFSEILLGKYVLICYTIHSEVNLFERKMMSNRFSFLPGMELVTRKQSKALYLIAPGPLGRGLKYREAAEELGISKASFIDRIRSFKDKFPEAWKNFLSIRDVSRRQRKSIQNPLSLDSLMDSSDFSEEDIVDKF